MPVVTGRAVPASATAAYRPVAEALLQLMRHKPLPDDPGLGPWLPALQPLVPPLVGEQPSAGEVSPAVRGEAVLQLLHRAAPDGVVVVLEDLHWADPDTVSVIEFLADNLGRERVLLVLTLRDSPSSPALAVARRQRGRPGMTYLALDRLTDSELATMVHACRPGASDDVLQRIQGSADGVPLLVEEMLASPGLPENLAATVTARLADLRDEDRQVIEAAAVLGRHFDWALLPALTAQTEDDVAGALARGVESLLLTSHGATIGFRHALTREAVLDTVLPPRQRQLAAAALAVLVAAHPTLEGGEREVAIDLAVRAGERHRAGGLLAESGRQSLGWGALATAAETLRRAAELLDGGAAKADAELGLVEALALAGRVDEAAAVGGRLVTRLADDPGTTKTRVEAHLRLAHAAVAASRWQMGRHQLDAARRLAGHDPTSSVAARIAVLDADLTMAADDHGAARAIAEGVLGMGGAPPEVYCHALEIIGRSHRSQDLAAAREAFERGLVIAEAADLPLWRLRALHELGTVDLFGHAGVERLLQARRAAEEMGAMSTAAVLDLQLSAAFTMRWDLDACDLSAHSAIAIAARLGLVQVRAKGFAMLCGSASMRADLAETERLAALTTAAAADDRNLEGFCWGSRGVALLLSGEAELAIEPYARGIAILGGVPHAEPAALRALWPLVLAARGDKGARRAIDEARRSGVAAIHINRALIGYAEAVLAGRDRDHRHAREIVAVADTGFANGDGWADLTRLLAAPAASADGWGDVQQWLSDGAAGFAQRGLPALAYRAEALFRQASPNPWSSRGVSAREADVLRLVVEGLANKEIAARLHLSPRTVEKHVESLLRKAGARSRTELATLMADSGYPGPTRGPEATPGPEATT